LAEGGRAILALPSQTSKGESRIVSLLKPGASVVTTRSHVHYIITEYGAVDLYGKTLRERARLLISIAHPDHRAELEAQAYQRYRSI
jgi:acyl-CoA hydrolase